MPSATYRKIALKERVFHQRGWHKEAIYVISWFSVIFKRYSGFFLFVFCFFLGGVSFFLLGPHLWHVEVPRLAV